LKKLNLRTGTNETLLDDPGGGIRDPQISYDGERILFSYRKRRTHRYHLYEMGIDGGNLRQLTDGDFDDIEPCYLPDGGVAFCSSRCNRYIGCWLVATATLFRMNEDGSDIRQLTSFGIRRKHADRSS
jgi:Tol biopolymer transport system component